MRPPVPSTFGWGATLILIAVVVVAIAVFSVWWSPPNRGRGRAALDSDAEVDSTESKERLDLLRSARQWGDASTTSESYLRREDRGDH